MGHKCKSTGLPIFVCGKASSCWATPNAISLPVFRVVYPFDPLLPIYQILPTCRSLPFCMYPCLLEFYAIPFDQLCAGHFYIINVRLPQDREQCGVMPAHLEEDKTSIDE